MLPIKRSCGLFVCWCEAQFNSLRTGVEGAPVSIKVLLYYRKSGLPQGETGRRDIQIIIPLHQLCIPHIHDLEQYLSPSTTVYIHTYDSLSPTVTVICAIINHPPNRTPVWLVCSRRSYTSPSISPSRSWKHCPRRRFLWTSRTRICS